LSVVAQEILPSEEAVVLDVDGAEGIWMPTPMARRIQKDAESVPLLKLTLTNTELQLDIRGERLDSCRDIVTRSAKQVESTERQMIELEQKYDTWYHKPPVWVGVGAVMLVVLEVAAVSMLKALR